MGESIRKTAYINEEQEEFLEEEPINFSKLVRQAVEEEKSKRRNNDGESQQNLNNKQKVSQKA